MDLPDRIEATRRWPVRIAGVLLAIQGAAAMLVALRLGLWTQWSDGFDRASLSAAASDLLSTANLLAILTSLALVSAVGFFFVRPGAWLLAMLLQAMTLAITLASHWGDGPRLMYVPMAYGVFMVFYVNSWPVRSVLHGRAQGGDGRG